MESLISYEGFSDQAFDNDNDEDIELDDWTPPDNELVQKMVSQIEHYLSDENLSKDAFLLKHVRRNKMGYVNIKLLTSFKKMKSLTKDWRTTAYALRRSFALELNAEGTKVRRKNPVPESLLVQVPSRLLLVWNIAPSAGGPWKSSMECAVATLSPFGAICTIRILRPRRELPLEIRKYGHKYPELCSQESVLVEYEDTEGAGRAYHALSQSGGLAKVVLVGRGSRKKAGLEADCPEDRNGGKGVAIVNRQMERLQFRGEDLSPCSSPESEFPAGLLCGSAPLGQSPKSSPRSSPRVLCPRASPLLALAMWRSPETSPEPDRRYPGDLLDGSPWVQRRRQAAARASSLDDGHAQSPPGAKRAPNGDSLPLGVVRYPLGPDGSRGFHSAPGRGRALHRLKI